MLQCDHYMPLDRYNPIVEGYLRDTGFYHVSQIGVVQCQSALVNALVERWRPETHTFHFPVGECAVTLEDVALILGLPTNGLPVTGPTLSSYEALETECLDQFGVAPMKADCRGSFIKLVWFRALKDWLELVDDIQIQRYVKCHIILLFGTVIFGNKSAAGVHWKFLPLLRNFAGIIQFSWGSACLAHLYRSLCRATRVDCKEIDGPLTLLLAWAWTRLPFIAPIPSNPRIFPIANRWRNWERQNRPYRFRTLENYRRDLDFVWEPYAIGRTDPDVIPPNIRQHSAIWSATVPLISFECIELHASDRLRRQFGLTQGIPNQERDLGEAHSEVLTGSKNQNWSGTHSFWVMHWMNRYSHILVDDTVPSQHQADIYFHWYRGRFGLHLHLSQIEPQENQPGDPMHNQEDQEVQSPPPPSPPQPPPPPSQTQAQQEPEQFTPYIPDTHSADYLTPPVYQQYWSVPHQESGEQGSFSQLLGFMAPVPGYSYPAYRDIPIDQMAQPSGISPGRLSLDTRPRQLTSFGTSGTAGTTTSEKGKGYNLRANPPRQSASRYTPSAFKKVAKKCKKLVKDVKWAMRK
ncbi:uncharacterized protein DS421_18g612210 [Arachis hypogaea]|nr:uncharacterized protein DS421_18g612210 [Arachis hypogaea]